MLDVPDSDITVSSIRFTWTTDNTGYEYNWYLKSNDETTISESGTNSINETFVTITGLSNDKAYYIEVESIYNGVKS